MALKRFILLSALVFAACSDNVASGASEDVGITPLGKWQVAGLSQKGPFVTGSTVNVFELEGSTLNQTGKKSDIGFCLMSCFEKNALRLRMALNSFIPILQSYSGNLSANIKRFAVTFSWSFKARKVPLS